MPESNHLMLKHDEWFLAYLFVLIYFFLTYSLENNSRKFYLIHIISKVQKDFYLFFFNVFLIIVVYWIRHENQNCRIIHYISLSKHINLRSIEKILLVLIALIYNLNFLIQFLLIISLFTLLKNQFLLIISIFIDPLKFSYVFYI